MTAMVGSHGFVKAYSTSPRSVRVVSRSRQWSVWLRTRTPLDFCVAFVALSCCVLGLRFLASLLLSESASSYLAWSYEADSTGSDNAFGTHRVPVSRIPLSALQQDGGGDDSIRGVRLWNDTRDPSIHIFAYHPRQRGRLRSVDHLWQSLSSCPFSRPANITTAHAQASLTAAMQRKEAVRGAIKHAWLAYQKYAFGHDTLQPLTKSYSDSMHLAETLVSSLDTLKLSGLEEEYKMARAWVQTNFSLRQDVVVSTFRLCTKILGGFLGAYDVTADYLYLQRSLEVASILTQALDTVHNIAYSTMNLRTLQGEYLSWSPGNVVLAEAGGLGLELMFLSRISQNSTLSDLAFKSIMQIHSQNALRTSLYSTVLDGRYGRPVNDDRCFGAHTDAFYANLLKMWLSSDKSQKLYHKMFIEAVQEMVQLFVQRSSASGLYYISGTETKYHVDQSTCFWPGLLALAHRTKGLTWRGSELLVLAKELLYTCYAMHVGSISGLAPALVELKFAVVANDITVASAGDSHWKLRSELAESLYQMYVTTRDPLYREWGWDLFQAILKHTKLDEGFAEARDVNQLPVPLDDKMNSDLLSKTLKYLYLLFDIAIHETHVFSFDGHPFRLPY
eukprot:GILJ01012461.1.p1 GENE.GILJ01012461.1~~GILJ01012461.1.p1  ORF type:complete len:618 (-),score=50.36 GILJ01012461.1:233-2086(-)